MIFTRSKTIFLHVPKTAGNAIQNQLIGFSDDKKDISQHQNGTDRFNVKGEITIKKHAKLKDYADRIDISDYTIAISCRDPLERLISTYFSPHRWQVNEEGTWKEVKPYWDKQRFQSILPSFKPIVSYLKVDKKIISPDIVIRFENINTGYRQLAERVVGNASIPELVPANVSFANKEEIGRAMNDPVAIEAAVALFREDYEMFGYKIPGI